MHRVFRSWRQVLGAIFATAMATGAFAEEEELSGSFFDDFETFDEGRWFIADGWNNGDWMNCTWSRDNLRLEDGILKFIYNERDMGDRGHACAEIQSHGRYKHGAYEVRLKTDVGSGLNAAFFTYIGPHWGKPHDEIDFEILTRDPSKVQVNAYIDGEANHTLMADVSPPANEAFHVYSFVWMPDRLAWYVNGALVQETTDPSKLPVTPQAIMASHWGSDTFKDWMGPFRGVDREHVMEVDWISYTAPGDPCQHEASVVCGAAQ